MYDNGTIGKEYKMKEIKRFLKEEDGMAVVEVVLILVVLIGLVVIFKSQITALIKKILKKVSTEAGSI
jgi:Flp pilus assembly pilin Flp